MNIYDASRRFGIGLRKLRDMEKQGIAAFDPPDPELSPIRHYLAQRKSLTVPHMVTLIEKPELIGDLEKHAETARTLLAEIGKPEPAPVSMHLAGAASGDAADVAALVEWAKGVIPAGRDVVHHYLAVRLLLGTPANLRRYEAPRLRRVMLNLRRNDNFAGWWHVENGKTWYHRPRNLNL